MSHLLELSDVDAGYGDFQALFGLSIHQDEGEVLAIIGANGAGKTTMLRAIAGAVRVTAGSIRFASDDLVGVPDHVRVRNGIALVPEGRRLFPSLSVTENLEIGGYSKRPGPWTVPKVLELFPLIEPLLERPADVLSGGEKQAVAIGRALMSNPRLILLDEVSLGLAPVVVRSIYEALPGITSEGTTALIVEQDVGQALEVADRVYCMLEGRVSLTGRPDELDREAVTAAYFGSEVV